MSKRKRRRSGSGAPRLVAPPQPAQEPGNRGTSESASSILDRWPWAFIAVSWVGIALVLSGVFSERNMLVYAGMLLWGVASAARGAMLWNRSRFGAGLQIAAGIGLLILVLADIVF